MEQAGGPRTALADPDLGERNAHEAEREGGRYINKCRYFRFLLSYHSLLILLMMNFADFGVR